MISCRNIDTLVVLALGKSQFLFAFARSGVCLLCDDGFFLLRFSGIFNAAKFLVGGVSWYFDNFHISYFIPCSTFATNHVT